MIATLGMDGKQHLRKDIVKAIKGGAKTNNFLNLCDAKAKARQVDGVRAITQYIARNKTIYSLRGSGMLINDAKDKKKNEKTIFTTS